MSCSSYTNAMTIQDLEDHVHLSVLHHNKRKVLFATSQNISHHNLHLCRSVGKLSRYLEQEFAGSANKNKRVRRSLDSFKYFVRFLCCTVETNIIILLFIHSMTFHQCIHGLKNCQLIIHQELI